MHNEVLIFIISCYILDSSYQLDFSYRSQVHERRKGSVSSLIEQTLNKFRNHHIHKPRSIFDEGVFEVEHEEEIHEQRGENGTCHICEEWNIEKKKHDTLRSDGCITHNLTRKEEWNPRYSTKDQDKVRANIEKDRVKFGGNLSFGSKSALAANLEETETNHEGSLPGSASNSGVNGPKKQPVTKSPDQIKAEQEKYIESLPEWDYKFSTSGKRIWTRTRWKPPKIRHFMPNYEHWEEEAMRFGVIMREDGYCTCGAEMVGFSWRKISILMILKYWFLLGGLCFSFLMAAC